MSSFPTLKFYEFWPTVSEIAFIVSDIVFWPSTILLISHGYNFLNCEMQTITVSTLGPTFVGTQTEGFHVNHLVQCSVQNKWSAYINFIFGSVKIYLEYSKKNSCYFEA